jgi:hypothetical protein
VAKRKNPAAVSLGRKGGKARLKTMTQKERTEAAKNAARARWEKGKMTDDWVQRRLAEPNSRESDSAGAAAPAEEE